MAQILSVCEKGKANISTSIYSSEDRACWESLCSHEHTEQVVYVLKEGVMQNNVLQQFVVERSINLSGA